MRTRRDLLLAAMPLGLLVMSGVALAQGQGQGGQSQGGQARARDRMHMPDPDQEPVYGSQLMTDQERLQYRDRMHSASTQEERERIREEHHAQMQERAKQQGVTLPDMPPAQGMGAGRRMGQGGSMGQGRGSGN